MCCLTLIQTVLLIIKSQSSNFVFRGSQYSGDMGGSCAILLRLNIQSEATLGDLALRDVHVRPHRHWPLRLQHDHADHRWCLPRDAAGGLDGSLRVAVVYMSGVVAGSLGTSLSDPHTFIAGASGGVYALIAAHLVRLDSGSKEPYFLRGPFLDQFGPYSQ